MCTVYSDQGRKQDKSSGPGASVTILVEYPTKRISSSHQVSPLPQSSYLSAGAFIDDDDGGYVLVCGGAQCDSIAPGTCTIQNYCYTWRPGNNRWEEFAFLNRPRYAGLITQVGSSEFEYLSLDWYCVSWLIHITYYIEY